MEEQEFFEYLLAKTRDVFQRSKTYINNNDKNWNFAVCETPIQKGAAVFFGLNWGGSNVDVQTQYPEKYKENGRTWNFVTHSRKYFRKYFDAEIEDLNYSNLCFFRTPQAYKLPNDDWELSIPLFKEYIDYINPPWTLLLGSADYLDEIHLTSKEVISLLDKKHNKYVNGCTGKLFAYYPFGSVPHPVAKISTEVRHEIWHNVKEKMMNINLSK